MKKSIFKLVLGVLLVWLVFSGSGTASGEDLLLKHEESIARLEVEVQSLKEDLTGIRDELTAIKKSLVTLQSSLISITGRIDPLSQRVEEVERDYRGRIADLSRRVEVVERVQTADYLEIEKSNWMMWKIQVDRQEFEDFVASANMRRVDGALGYYGMLFRFTDKDLYYFWIRDDGYYGLSKSIGEEWFVLRKMTGSEAINSKSWNNLTVRADGSNLSLIVNGEQLDTIVDESIKSGMVAVVAETGADQNYLKVLFNDFTIEELN